MSHETVKLAREVLAALGPRDPSRLIALSDPEVECHSFFALGEQGGVYHGHDGMRRWMRDLSEAWDIGHAEVDEALGIADIAVLVGRIHFRGKGSGVESTSPAGWRAVGDGKSHRPRPGGLAAARLRAQARLSTALRLSAARLIGCDEAVGCRLPTPLRLASLGHERV